MLLIKGKHVGVTALTPPKTILNNYRNGRFLNYDYSRCLGFTDLFVYVCIENVSKFRSTQFIILE